MTRSHDGGAMPAKGCPAIIDPRFSDPKIAAFPGQSFPAKVGKRKKGKSQYERYPLPFFDGKRRLTWAVKPTGIHSVDCKIGREFAIEFLKSNDGTVGWTTMLAQIVGDMIRAGPDGAWPNGEPKTSGLVIGFMTAIGRLICATSRSVPGEMLADL